MRKRILSLLLIFTIILGPLTQLKYAEGKEILQGETPSGISLNNLETSIDNYVSKYIGKTTPGAAIAVVKDGQVIFSKGYGYGDIENKIPVDPSTTVFEWGSISKLFTWTAVMQLVEQGKLDLDEDISVYLPEDFMAQLDLNQSITIRDIMNHSAGFGNYAFNTVAFTPDDVVSLEEAILRDKPAQYYKVGTASAYSNYATSIAGYIVQTVSGQNYNDYQRSNMFDVLSMDNSTSSTTYEDNQSLLSSKAKGYIPSPSGEFALANWSYVSHGPAGSFSGTVNDFTKYIMALTPENDKPSPLFNNRSTLDTMLSPSYDTSKSMVGTSHGFFEYAGSSKTLGHSGNTAAFSSQFVFVPEERFGVIILTNAYLEMDILFGLQDLLIGNRELSPSQPNLPATTDVEGKYVPFDRQEGNMVDFIKYINLYTVTAIDQDTINLSIGPYTGVYKQTKPYYYELLRDDMPIFRNAYPVLRFKMGDSKVEQIIVGHGLDLSILPKGRTMPILIGSALILIISMLFFIITPIVMLILIIKHRKHLNKAALKLRTSLLLLVLCGTLTLINNIIPPGMIMVNHFRNFAEVKPFILLNYPLGIFSGICITWALLQLRKNKSSRKQWVIYGLTTALLIMLYAMLIGWNFFVISA